MSVKQTTVLDSVHRGLEIYEAQLKAKLEPDFNGQQVVVNVEDGDYEVAPTTDEAAQRLRARHPRGEFVIMEVGHPVMEWPWARM